MAAVCPSRPSSSRSSTTTATLLHYRSFLSEIGQRKRAEAELARSEEQARHLITHAPAAIYEIDFRGPRYVSVNDFMCEYSGYSREELLAIDPFELLVEADRPAFRDRIRKALAGEQTSPRMEYRCRTKQGEERYAVLNITPTFDDGRPVGAFVVAHDITERKHAEADRERLVEQLSRSNEREARVARTAETLSKVNEILLSALTLDDVLARLVGEASRAAGADKALVIRVTDGSYTITHVRNVRADLVGKPKDAAFYPGFALAVAKRRPILVADNWGDERLNQEFVVAYGLHAFQLLPLMVEGVVSHVLALSYDEAQVFDADDYLAAERMTAAMSVALGNARLFEAEQHARRQATWELEFTQVLLDVSGVVADWTELEPMLERLADVLLASAGHSRATISLWDEQRKAMTIVVSKGEHPIPLSTMALAELSAPVRRMIKTRKRVLIDYARAKDERLRKLAARRRLRHGLAVPVVARGRLIAAIAVDAPGERQAFSEREVDLIQAVADQAAVAIENARFTEGLAHERGAGALPGRRAGTREHAVRHAGAGWSSHLLQPGLCRLTGYSREELEQDDGMGSRSHAGRLVASRGAAARRGGRPTAPRALREGVRAQGRQPRAHRSLRPAGLRQPPAPCFATARFWRTSLNAKRAEQALHERRAARRPRSASAPSLRARPRESRHEVFYDDGRAVDYRVIDVNSSFESHTGMSAQHARAALQVSSTAPASRPSSQSTAGRRGRPAVLLRDVLRTDGAPLSRHGHLACSGQVRHHLRGHL